MRRAERKNRDAFREMLEEHIAAGTLTAKTHWRDYCQKVYINFFPYQVYQILLIKKGLAFSYSLGFFFFFLLVFILVYILLFLCLHVYVNIIGQGFRGV